MNLFPHFFSIFNFNVPFSEEVALKICIVYRKICLFCKVCCQDSVQGGIQSS